MLILLVYLLSDIILSNINVHKSTHILIEKHVEDNRLLKLAMRFHVDADVV